MTLLGYKLTPYSDEGFSSVVPVVITSIFNPSAFTLKSNTNCSM